MTSSSKQQRSYDIDPKSISADALDNARNAEKIAATNLKVIERQYELTKAGAWTYDVQNAERSYTALAKAYQSSAALLAKYTIRAPADGVVMAVNSSVGSYVSSQGAYDTYTEGFGPLIVMGCRRASCRFAPTSTRSWCTSCRHPKRSRRRCSCAAPACICRSTFVRIQPYVSPKIELSDAREERVDLRVLPIVFRFEKPKDLNLYPGQLVDVYVGAK